MRLTAGISNDVRVNTSCSANVGRLAGEEGILSMVKAEEPGILDADEKGEYFTSCLS